MIYLKIAIDILVILIAYEIGIKVGKEKGMNECDGICGDCQDEIYAKGWNNAVDFVLSEQEAERTKISEQATVMTTKPTKVKKTVKIVSKKSKK